MDIFPFLALPQELRNHIYRYLLAPNTTLFSSQRYKVLYTTSTNVRVEPISRDIHLGILLVSKQVYTEAKRILYGRNTLLLELYEGLPLERQTRIFPPSFNQNNLELVNNLVLEVTHFFDRPGNEPVDIKILSSCINLQVLCLELRIANETSSGARISDQSLPTKLGNRIIYGLEWMASMVRNRFTLRWTYKAASTSERYIVGGVYYSLHFRAIQSIPMTEIVDVIQEARRTYENED